MIKVLSTNITSPLGYTSEENFRAVQTGESGLRQYNSWKCIPEKICASLFSEEQLNELIISGFTRFESIVIRSVREALSHTDIPICSDRVVFILSTTKGNVEELSDSPENDGKYISPGASAGKIARELGISTTPIVVCNACISGVSAQILADRLIDNGLYDYAVVCGADCQSPFTVSGFLSFRSMSPEPCRPFDIERLGLNLGEAAATIIYGMDSSEQSKETDESWKLVAGALTSDAYHLSAPSPDGCGVLEAINKTISGYDSDKLAFINAHGTATMFNDQMEAKAITGAGLSNIPVSALKGYFGHTLGASGVLECIISMMSLDESVIPASRGYEECGVSEKINISNVGRKAEKKDFLKIISGFGACNGAALYSKDKVRPINEISEAAFRISHSIRLTDNTLELDGENMEIRERGKELLSALYREQIGDYPRFHKMDMLNKLAFVASELLLQKERESSSPDNNRAVIVFNSSSTIMTDRKHISSYAGKDGFFPSPSIFLYTLPNIINGEIAIRNKYKGESSCYLTEEKDEKLMENVIKSTFNASKLDSMLCAWVECSDENNFEAEIKIFKRIK